MFKEYTLLDKREIKELNGIGYRLEHNKTKAKVVVISNDDDNKVFQIGFRTPPADDTGVPHILEHSVLCGSKEFPAKDPFVELVKGSLNTFLNAMTYSDKTVYPVASCNSKDFHNLMHVYLDAVFYPNIYQQPKIFQQEGWHYELNNADEPLIYNGVVYNEMKGVFSSAEEQLMRAIQRSLLPGTPYENESGGDPEYITDLTYEDFLAFHETYYHPSNSYIYLYGDVDMEAELKFIDEHYLSQFDYKEVDSSINMASQLSETVYIEESYSISETEPLENNTYLSYNMLIGTSLDKELSMVYQILDYVLLSSPGAPLKKALIDTGICKDVYSSYDNGILQPTFSIIAKNANKEDRDKFIQVIESELATYVKDGIDPRSLEAAINFYEFKYKEANFGSYPKGLMQGLKMYNSWLYDETQPFLHLETNEIFATLKEKLGTGYFEAMVDTYMIKNKHKTIVIITPQKGLNAKAEEVLKKKLADYKGQQSTQVLEKIITDTKDLKDYQEKASSKEELEKIPLLSIDDIEKKARPIHNKELNLAGVPVIHHDIFTNGIAYFDFAFYIDHLTCDQLSWASLLSNIFRYVDTEQYSYKELSNEINIQTGGISTNIMVLNQTGNKSKVLFDVNAKALFSKVNEMFGVAQELILKSDLTDTKRIKEIISEIKGNIQMRLSRQGHSAAVNRAISYFSEAGFKKELTSNISFYEFLTDLEANFETKKDEIVKELIHVSKLIFQKKNLVTSYTGDQEPKELMEQLLADFTGKLYTQVWDAQEERLPISIKNEGFKTASQVQYVATAGNFVNAGYEYTGALNVLQVMFSYDYLWNNIRVKGGAYGAMSGFSRFGDSYFASYRDPNLMETYKIYQNAYHYVKNFDCDDRDMTKYIIGAISNQDTPLEPVADGMRSFMTYLLGMNQADLQRERDELLATNQETIRNLADLIKSITDYNTICAVGDEQKLEENKDSFKQLLSIF